MKRYCEIDIGISLRWFEFGITSSYAHWKICAQFFQNGNILINETVVREGDDYKFSCQKDLTKPE